jgi:hypothetical protein
LNEQFNWVTLTRDFDDGEKALYSWLSPYFFIPKQRIAHTSQQLSKAIGNDAIKGLSLLSKTTPIILLLDKSLPDPIHHIDWESLINGNPTLNDKVLVLRYANALNLFNASRRLQSFRVYDLFPENDWPEETRVALNRVPNLRRSKAATYDLMTSPTESNLRVIFAHGDRQQPPAITDSTGAIINLDKQATLPEIFWLFACGEATLTLQHWLEDEVRNEIVQWGLVAADKINAEQSFLLFERLLICLQNEPDKFCTTFFNGQRQWPETRSLRIIGTPRLGKENFTSTLLKLFFLHYEHSNGLKRLREELEKTWGEGQIFQELFSLLPEAPNYLKKQVILPLCIYYAERIEQKRLSMLLNEANNASPSSMDGSIFLAKGLYRKGIYLRSLKVLLRFEGRSSDYFITLNNLLSDLNLAQANRHLEKAMRLLESKGKVTIQDKLKWLGSLRASHIKKGNLEQALNLTQKKIKLDSCQLSYEEPNIVYLNALLKNKAISSEGKCIITSAKKSILSNDWNNLASLIGKKDSSLYLIRAMALHSSIMEHDTELRDSLRNLFKSLEQHLSDYFKADLGALCLGYGFFLLKEPEGKEKWATSLLRDELIAQHYFIETAVIDYLLNIDGDDEVWETAISIQQEALKEIQESPSDLAKNLKSELNGVITLQEKHLQLINSKAEDFDKRLATIIQLGLFPY